MRKFIITANIAETIGVREIPFMICHNGKDVSKDIQDYEEKVEFGTPDFSCKIQPDKKPQLDYIHVQSIVKNDSEIHWVGEYEPRTHTAVYARLTDNTLTHLADFTDREDALQFVVIIQGLLKLQK